MIHPPPYLENCLITSNSSSISSFSQAEDSIRDYKVTGVQTCALPILRHAEEGGIEMESVAPSSNFSDYDAVVIRHRSQRARPHAATPRGQADARGPEDLRALRRSEERRVGEEYSAGRTAQEWRITLPI